MIRRAATPIASGEGRAAPVFTPPSIIDAIAVADVEEILRTESPDRVLNQARKVGGVVVTKLARVDSQSEANDGLWLVPDLPCQSIPVTVMTNGPLTVGPMAAGLPSIGVRFHTTIGKDTLKPLPIIDTLPRRYRIIPAEQPADKAVVALAGNADAVELTFRNLALAHAGEGGWLDADVTASLAAMTGQPAAATPDQLAEKARDALQATRAACVEDSHVEILISGLDLGQITDPAKLFAAAGKVLGNAAKQAADELQRQVDAAAQAARDAAEEAKRQADAAAQAAQQALDEAKRQADAAAQAAADAARRAPDILPEIPLPEVHLPHIHNPF